MNTIQISITFDYWKAYISSIDLEKILILLKFCVIAIMMIMIIMMEMMILMIMMMIMICGLSVNEEEE